MSNSSSIATPDETSDYDDDRSRIAPVGGIILTIFAFLVVNCVLVATIMCTRRTRHVRVMQGEGGRTDAPLTTKKERTERRYRAIEKWVVSKAVCEHDDVCDMLLRKCRKSNSESSDKDRESSENKSLPLDEEWACPSFGSDCEDDNVRECPICMDVIAKEEIVSWSANAKCNHIFHHQCIKQWLLKHRDCPFCRACFLPVDAEVLSESEIDKHRIALTEYSKSCFYCIDHGIVSLPADTSSHCLSDNEVADMRKRAAEVPDLQELVRFRGKCKVIPEPVNASEICISTAAEAEAGDNTPSQSNVTSQVANDEEQGVEPQSSVGSDANHA